MSPHRALFLLLFGNVLGSSNAQPEGCALLPGPRYCRFLRPLPFWHGPLTFTGAPHGPGPHLPMCGVCLEWRRLSQAGRTVAPFFQGLGSWEHRAAVIGNIQQREVAFRKLPAAGGGKCRGAEGRQWGYWPSEMEGGRKTTEDSEVGDVLGGRNGMRQLLWLDTRVLGLISSLSAWASKIPAAFRARCLIAHRLHSLVVWRVWAH